mmetsp:Transcript_7772/g.14110  ORF Transcript_7772/g.14110 Transcript_7772/m.14110 type:complete len:134 (+) Transcript_7772:1573-1974(+)
MGASAAFSVLPRSALAETGLLGEVMLAGRVGTIFNFFLFFLGLKRLLPARGEATPFDRGEINPLLLEEALLALLPLGDRSPFLVLFPSLPFGLRSEPNILSSDFQTELSTFPNSSCSTRNYKRILVRYSGLYN